MTGVFFLFLLHAALGLVALLPLVPRQAGARFFKFCSATAALLAAAGLAFLARRFGMTPPARAALLFVLLVLLYNRAEHFGWARLRRALLGTALGAGVLAALVAAGPSAFRALTSLSSAFVLGAAGAALILGHWYLVVLDLPIRALRRLTVALVAGLALRALVVTWGALGPARRALDAALAVAGGTFDPDGVFVWMRLLFGLLGPLTLVGFIWKTVEIRSTQSATGILYVQLFLVMTGELLATHLRVVAGLPL